MNKKKVSTIEKRDALLAEMASLRGLLNGSLVLSAFSARFRSRLPAA